jgi:hypothetical protein
MFKLFERPQKQPEEDDNQPTQGIGMSGNLTVKVYDRAGNLKSVRGPMRNMVVQIGKSYICNQLGSGISQNKTKRSCRWTGIGHSSTAATKTQTKLLTQKSRKRNLFTFTSGRGYYSCISTFTSFGAGTKKSTIYESGLFWQSGTTDSVMLARQTFAAVTKLTADTLTVEWRVSTS